MKIERSEEVQSQLKEASALRTKLIDHFTNALDSGVEKKKGKNKPPNHPLIQTLELSSEGFSPVFLSVQVSQVDRTASMLAGPFFTSEEHPIPATSAGMLLPVIQLNLKEISELSGLDLGDGLLQLWCDPDWSNINRGTISVISRQEIETQKLTPFTYERHPGAYESPLPRELIFDPAEDGDAVKVISGYESVGLQCQTSYIDVYTEDISLEAFDPVADELLRFSELTESDFKLHVLGSFYPIQYSAADVGWSCLVHFPTWGSSGNAQVFFTQKYGDFVFRFDESLR